MIFRENILNWQWIERKNRETEGKLWKSVIITALPIKNQPTKLRESRKIRRKFLSFAKVKRHFMILLKKPMRAQIFQRRSLSWIMNTHRRMKLRHF